MKMKKRAKKVLALSVLIVFSLVGLFGCVQGEEKGQPSEQTQKEETKSEPTYPMTVKDAFDREVTIEKKPMRIVSLSPSHTEILFGLGLGDRVVGVTNYCDYPEEAKSKEKVGDSQSVNIEKIIELKPDLVIQYGQGKEEVNQSIAAAGITLLSYEPESIQEVINLIKEVGRITDSNRAATMLTVDMQARMDFIVHKLDKEEKVKVFYEVWDNPLMTAGPGSFIDEFINLAGGENIAKDAKDKYPQFDLEQLIARNPEVYLTANDLEGKTKASIKARAGYDALDAIKNDRVYLLDGNILSRPGPRVIKALEIVAKAIHPEVFNE